MIAEAHLVTIRKKMGFPANWSEDQILGGISKVLAFLEEDEDKRMSMARKMLKARCRQLKIPVS